MFGDKKNNSEEIGKLWERLVPLEDETEQLKKIIQEQKAEIESLTEKVKQPTDNAKAATSAMRSIAQHKSKVLKSREVIDEYCAEVKKNKDQIEKFKQESENYCLQIEKQNDVTEKTAARVSLILTEIENKQTQLADALANISTLISDNTDLESKLAKVHSLIEEIDDASSKSDSMLKVIVTNHSKVRDLKNEILGYDEADDAGNTQRIEGLKDELEASYESLEAQLEETTSALQQIAEKTQKDYEELLKKQDSDSESFLKNYKTKYEDLYEEITKLLPQALTAGLSAAYDDKVKNELTYLEAHKKTFSKAIWGLVAISTIPFAIDVYLLLGMKKDLIEILSDTPKLIISIFPLYLPILWIAYSSNKKQNLSKRLIEEYTHKGVISKTFEGLSNQIDELDANITDELRVKLLFNLLQVNSENPGKLISDYNTTDHPLMDALDKSSRLGYAIEKLNNIPGFGKLVRTLEIKKKDILAKENEIVSDIIDKKLNSAERDS